MLVPDSRTGPFFVARQQEVGRRHDIRVHDQRIADTLETRLTEQQRNTVDFHQRKGRHGRGRAVTGPEELAGLDMHVRLGARRAVDAVAEPLRQCELLCILVQQHRQGIMRADVGALGAVRGC